MTWFLYALLTAVLWSSAAILGKYVVDHEVEDPVAVAVFTGSSLFSVLGVISIVLGGSLDSLPLGSVLVGGLYALTLISFYWGMESEEVSRFSPTICLGGVFVALLSYVFLGERLPWQAYAGISSVVFGAFLVSVDNPLSSVTSLHSSQGFWLGVITALLFSVRDVFVKWFTASVSYWDVLLGLSIGGVFMVLCLVFVRFNEVRSGLGCGAKHLISIGAVVAAGYASYVLSIVQGPVSLASAVIRSQSLFVFIGSLGAAYWFPSMFSEEFEVSVVAQKATAVMFVVAGLVLLQLV